MEVVKEATCVRDAVLTETDIAAAIVTVQSQKNSDSKVPASGKITRPCLRIILSTFRQPKAIEAEAQLVPGNIHLTGRQPWKVLLRVLQFDRILIGRNVFFFLSQKTPTSNPSR